MSGLLHGLCAEKEDILKMARSIKCYNVEWSELAHAGFGIGGGERESWFIDLCFLRQFLPVFYV